MKGDGQTDRRKDGTYSAGVKDSASAYVVFAGSVRSGLLTLRDMDRDLDRSTVLVHAIESWLTTLVSVS